MIISKFKMKQLAYQEIEANVPFTNDAESSFIMIKREPVAVQIDFTTTQVLFAKVPSNIALNYTMGIDFNIFDERITYYQIFVHDPVGKQIYFDTAPDEFDVLQVWPQAIEVIDFVNEDPKKIQVENEISG